MSVCPQAKAVPLSPSRSAAGLTDVLLTPPTKTLSPAPHQA